MVERHVETVSVGGSIPSFCTNRWSYRLMAKTADCRSANGSSILPMTANVFQTGDPGEHDCLLSSIKAGSSPASGAKLFPLGAMVATPDFESGDLRSNREGGANQFR